MKDKPIGVIKWRLQPKGNKDDSEDGQQKLPYLFNIPPTKHSWPSYLEVEDYELKERVTVKVMGRYSTPYNDLICGNDPVGRFI